MADLAKHVVDFMFSNEDVQLSSFRERFYSWLKDTYPTDDVVKAWIEKYGDHDFRRAIASQAMFLCCQASQVDKSYLQQRIWSEILPQELSAVPEQIEVDVKPEQLAVFGGNGSKDFVRKTTVTPYAFDCFRHLPWARFLDPQSPADFDQYRNVVSSFHEGSANRGSQRQSISSCRISPNEGPVQVGDVVALQPDSVSSWKSQGKEWLAYVQALKATSEGFELGLLWLYRPSDTACMKMAYPHQKELFLSDHCNCGDSPVLLNDVLRKPAVAFHGNPSSKSEFFCRQQYMEGNAAWITLQESHFQCTCRRLTSKKQWSIGDTVLFLRQRHGQKASLRPSVILGMNPSQDSVTLRLLLRKRSDYSMTDAAPNELIYSDHVETVPLERIERHCCVGFYSVEARDTNKIPAPYNREGSGDHYYICTRQGRDSLLEALRQPWPTDLTESWNPHEPSLREPLKALEMFCGGGNFGRGMEEAGAVQCTHAIDHFNQAIHTYKANRNDAKDIALFRGSVNHFLSEALKGMYHDGLIAAVGEVEVIVAGSPCQGFSLLNLNKGADGALINESLVASVVSFMDFYRPKYALLENVKGMASGGEDKNVFAAVLCAFVGMGYQVRTFCLDAWSFGSPQSRTRIFISLTAPGLCPLEEPPQTHGHPENVIGGSLGRTANGLQLSGRCQVPTPFDYISAEEATHDLPVSDAKVIPIAYPDHRCSRVMSVMNNICISCVPRFPGGSGFLAAHERGWMPKRQVQKFSWTNEIRAGKKSRAWSRLKRGKLMPTITTSQKPEDGVHGGCLHWDQHRLLTILEARRAQGFPDHEVLVGSIAEQYKIVGNSVPRPLSLALGLSLRQAWLADSPDNGTPAQSVKSIADDNNGANTNKPKADWAETNVTAPSESGASTPMSDSESISISSRSSLPPMIRAEGSMGSLLALMGFSKGAGLS